MLIGYAWVPTHGQTLNLQQGALTKAGCAKIFTQIQVLPVLINGNKVYLNLTFILIGCSQRDSDVDLLLKPCYVVTTSLLAGHWLDNRVGLWLDTSVGEHLASSPWSPIL
jgi:hypothetical protein